MILPTDRVNKNIKRNKYLVCAYCSSKDLKKGKETDGLIEALKNDERVK
jgi:DNA-directed RNA polymerase subunit RPC12/RpoP